MSFASRARQAAASNTRVYHQAGTGRYLTNERERIAAARARVAADKRRGKTTEPWIVELTQKRRELTPASEPVRRVVAPQDQ